METKKGMKIIGIKTRTKNDMGKPNLEIMNLWNQFMSENIIEKIPNKVNQDIYSIYTDYESNFMGEYNLILGLSVTSLDHIPEGMIGRQFDDEKFKIYEAKGSMPGAVINTWVEIWKNDAALNRKYSYDYEIYNEKSRNGDDSVVNVHIALK
jgi:predicted transcriptional regulator YdeE